MLEGWPGPGDLEHLPQAVRMKLLCRWLPSHGCERAASLSSPASPPLTSHMLVFPTCTLPPISRSCPHPLPQLSSTCVIRLKVNFCSLSPQGQALFPAHDLDLVECGTKCLSSSPASLTCPRLTASPVGQLCQMRGEHGP